MLQPKKTKFRRMQKGRMKGIAQRGNQLAYGSFAIKALDSAWITGRQIEAARIAVTRYMQREGQIWIRIFPDKPVTKKPADVRFRFFYHYVLPFYYLSFYSVFVICSLCRSLSFRHSWIFLSGLTLATTSVNSAC